MEGDYAKQFKIQQIAPNKQFVNHPYKACKCENSDVICFDLVKGAGPCVENRTRVMGYDIQGKLIEVPFNQPKFKQY